MRRFLGVVIVFMLFMAETAVARPKAPQASNDVQAPAKAASVPSNRTKSIDFEDSVIEGLNANPRDALEQTAKRDGDGKSHLYWKKTNFNKEM